MGRRVKVALAGVSVALGVSLPVMFTPTATTEPPVRPKPGVTVDGPLAKIRGNRCPPDLTHVECRARFPAP